jgi:hypothetical protein
MVWIHFLQGFIVIRHGSWVQHPYIKQELRPLSLCQATAEFPVSCRRLLSLNLEEWGIKIRNLVPDVISVSCSARVKSDARIHAAVRCSHDWKIARAKFRHNCAFFSSFISNILTQLCMTSLLYCMCCLHHLFMLRCVYASGVN